MPALWTATRRNGGGGFIATSSGSSVLLDIQRSSAELNSGVGVNADGFGTSTASNNTTGFSQTNGGVIRSYGNNTVDSNTSNGGATGPTLNQL